MMVSNEDPSGERRITLPRDSSGPSQARRFVARLLQDRRLPPEAVGNALLVSSELVTNAYEHGRGEIELRLQVFDEVLRIEVIDEGRDQAPAVREQPPDDTGGWGLRIIDHLALQWGVFEGTTHVWADLPLRRP